MRFSGAISTRMPRITIIVLSFGQLLLAADSTPASTSGTPAADAAHAAHPATPAANGSESLVARWFDINAMNFSLRYRSIFDGDGVHTDDQAQQRTLLDGKFKFDSQGKYSIGFRLSSGQYFDWAYSDFIGGGTTQGNLKSIPGMSPADREDAIGSGPAAAVYPSGGWAILPRQLYLDAKPIDGIELQYGSLGFNRGDNSEITSFDDDGYIAGGRLIVRKPQYLYFDEISVTYAYLGDIMTPNFFDRYQRLSQSNYHQFLLRKRLTRWLDVSTDYTYEVTHTIREAAYIKTKWAKAVDSVRVEAYQRPFDANNVDTDDYASGSGFAITAEKSIRKKVLLQAGYADVDYNYDVYAHNGNNSIWAFALNGDSYGMGKRPFVRATVNVTPYISLFGYYTHLIDYNYARDGFVWNQTALNAGVQVDFKKLFNLSSH
jgi:hypothetical protein